MKMKYFKKNYLDHMPENKEAKIIDVGCGRGEYLTICKQLGYNNVEGIDLSTTNVEYCNKQGHKCILADANDYLPKNPDTYDVIIFNDCIEYLKKQEMVDMLIAMRKSLKKDGVLMVKTINAANPYVNGSGRYVCIDHEISFVDRSMRQVLTACGFDDVLVRGTDIYVIYGILGKIAKGISKIICFNLYLKSCLFGRTSIKVFEKNLIAFAYRRD